MISDSKRSRIEDILESSEYRSNGIADSFQFLINNTEYDTVYIWNKVLKKIFVENISGLKSWNSSREAGFRKFVVSRYSKDLPNFIRIRNASKKSITKFLDKIGVDESGRVSTLLLEVQISGNNWKVFGFIHVRSICNENFVSESKEFSDQVRSHNIYSPFLTLDSENIIGSEPSNPNIIKLLSSYSGVYTFNSRFDKIDSKLNNSSTKVKLVNPRKSRDIFKKDIVAAVQRSDLNDVSDRPTIS